MAHQYGIEDTLHDELSEEEAEVPMQPPPSLVSQSHDAPPYASHTACVERGACAYFTPNSAAPVKKNPTGWCLYHVARVT